MHTDKCRADGHGARGQEQREAVHDAEIHGESGLGGTDLLPADDELPAGLVTAEKGVLAMAQAVLACDAGEVLIARLLIEARANVNATKTNGSTPLFKAACDGHTACARLLADARANLDLQFHTGATALFVSVCQSFRYRLSQAL